MNFNPVDLAELWFKLVLTPTQRDILSSVLKGDKRIIISAMTRYGKSLIVSISVLLYVFFNDNKRVVVVSPTYTQSRIILDYVSKFILDCPNISNLVDFEVNAGAERLKKEVSKNRITFKNGSEIRILSAEGKAERLMGFGADLVIEDESCLISNEVYRMRISRMLGDNPDAMLVEIGNPFDKTSHMYDNWLNPDFKKFHINWQKALEEGRTTRDFIEEQKRLLSPLEFKILYEAEFPDDTEDTLIKFDWIKKALETEGIGTGRRIVGIDVAEGGVDLTVITKVVTKNNFFSVVDLKYFHEKDTMATVGLITEFISDFKPDLVNVDAIGVGKGVADRLREKGFPVNEVKVGKSAFTEQDRFLNLKAQLYWNLRSIFEEGRISLIDKGDLVHELNSMKFELTSSGKVKIIDPEKSPDFADGLMLGVFDYNVGGEVYVGRYAK